MLRTASQNRNIKLHDIAANVVASTRADSHDDEGDRPNVRSARNRLWLARGWQPDAAKRGEGFHRRRPTSIWPREPGHGKVAADALCTIIGRPRGVAETLTHEARGWLGRGLETERERVTAPVPDPTRLRTARVETSRRSRSGGPHRQSTRRPGHGLRCTVETAMTRADIGTRPT